MTEVETLSRRLYSVSDVAQLAGISRATVTLRHRTYEIGTKVGASIVFTHAEMETMLSWPYRPGRPPSYSR